MAYSGEPPLQLVVNIGGKLMVFGYYHGSDAEAAWHRFKARRDTISVHFFSVTRERTISKASWYREKVSPSVQKRAGGSASYIREE